MHPLNPPIVIGATYDLNIYFMIKIISLPQGIPTLAYTLSSVSVVLDLATAMDR